MTLAAKSQYSAADSFCWLSKMTVISTALSATTSITIRQTIELKICVGSVTETIADTDVIMDAQKTERYIWFTMTALLNCINAERLQIFAVLHFQGFCLAVTRRNTSVSVFTLTNSQSSQQMCSVSSMTAQSILLQTL